MLFRSGHYHFTYTPAERAKLRKYLLGGGMIIYNTGLGSKPFYDSVVQELKQIFPEQPLQRLAPDHPIFHSHYDVDHVEYTKAVAASPAIAETSRSSMASRSIAGSWRSSPASAWRSAGRAR